MQIISVHYMFDQCLLFQISENSEIQISDIGKLENEKVNNFCEPEIPETLQQEKFFNW